jgi:hypothetical protein
VISYEPLPFRDLKALVLVTRERGAVIQFIRMRDIELIEHLLHDSGHHSALHAALPLISKTSYVL